MEVEIISTIKEIGKQDCEVGREAIDESSGKQEWTYLEQAYVKGNMSFSK